MSTQTFGPYTPVRSAGTTYYTSGQVGVDPTTKQAPPDIAAQTEQVLKNLAAVLAEQGLGMEHVVKTTIYITHMEDFAALNAVYEQHFPAPRPARSTVGVSDLPHVGGDTAILVEIEAVAYKEAE